MTSLLGASAKSGQTHSQKQESERSKKRVGAPLAAPPVAPYAVRSPDGAIIPASAYDWRRGDILVPVQEEA